MTPLGPARIAALLEPYAVLHAGEAGQIGTYVDLLQRWNARVNLTAVRREEDIVTRHFGESLFAARRLLGGEAISVFDLGSGAGFPGLPLALHTPQAQVTLIEANGKKAAFLREVIAALGLKNARVFQGRAEDCREEADLVTMRAVEKFEQSLTLAAGLVRPGGRLGLLIGSSQVDAAQRSGVSFEWQPPVPVPGGHSRVLLVGIKSATVG